MTPVVPRDPPVDPPWAFGVTPLRARTPAPDTPLGEKNPPDFSSGGLLLSGSGGSAGEGSRPRGQTYSGSACAVWLTSTESTGAGTAAGKGSVSSTRCCGNDTARS